MPAARHQTGEVLLVVRIQRRPPGRHEHTRGEPGEHELTDQLHLVGLQRQHSLVRVQERAGRGPRVGGLSQQRGQADREVADPGGVVHVAEVDHPRDAPGLDQDVAQSQVTMRHERGQPAGRRRQPLEAIEQLLHRFPAGRVGQLLRERPQRGDEPWVPVQPAIGRRVDKPLHRPRQSRAHRTEVGREVFGQRREITDRARHHGHHPHLVHPAVRSRQGHRPRAVDRVDDAWNRQLRVHLGDMPHRRALHLDLRRIVAGVRHLDDEPATVGGRQEVQVALAAQGLELGGDPVAGAQEVCGLGQVDRRWLLDQAGRLSGDQVHRDLSARVTRKDLS